MSIDAEDSDSHDEPAESPDQEIPLSLVAGRERRSTAGNRLHTLLEKEGDDELELLFAEDEAEEDVEFREDDEEHASDVQLDSSSDDDQGPMAGADDLDGERELEKQEKAEKRKNRKAQEVYKRPALLPKRVRVDPTATSVHPSTPTARSKKKSERLSWLPTSDEGPVRSSSRMQTVQNKEVVHQRMQQHEQRRKRQIKVMEAAAAKKEAARPRALTQADRMAEAARVEKKNAKSLNRWEEAEKDRLEEQKARLEALHNRTLEGPVISWWSGSAHWINGKLATVGKLRVVEDVKETSKRRGKLAKDLPDDQSAHAETTSARVSAADAQPASVLRSSKPPLQEPTADGHPAPPQESTVDGHPAPPAPSAHAAPAASLVPGAAANPFIPLPPPPEEEGKPGAEGWHEGLQPNADVEKHSPQPSARGWLPHPPPDLTTASPLAPASLRPPAVERATRNLVTLVDLDSAAMRMPELQNHVLLRKKFKLSKPGPPVCAITLHPARYCDPTTNLPYANAYAFKEIQKLSQGSCVWNDVLGCFVGSVDGAARGVPPDFVMKPTG